MSSNGNTSGIHFYESKRSPTVSTSSLTTDWAGRTGQVRILAPSGDHFELTVTGGMRIVNLKAEIFDSWPKELLHEEKPESPDCLKFLYQGRFQADDTFIKDLPLAFEEVITVHLFISPGLQEADAKGTGRCLTCCCIT